MLTQDPHSRVTVETMLTTGLVHVTGEVTTTSDVPIADIARRRTLNIGYDSSATGFDDATCGVSISLRWQSTDTAHESRVEGLTDDEIDRQGAGDQHLMFGYACQDTPELIPLPIALAHRLSRRLTDIRKNGLLPYLRPDGKAPVTIEYTGDRPVRLDTVVPSIQHADHIRLDVVLTDLDLATPDTSDVRLLANPTGTFVLADRWATPRRHSRCRHQSRGLMNLVPNSANCTTGDGGE